MYNNKLFFEMKLTRSDFKLQTRKLTSGDNASVMYIYIQCGCIDT